MFDIESPSGFLCFHEAGESANLRRLSESDCAEPAAVRRGNYAGEGAASIAMVSRASSRCSGLGASIVLVECHRSETVERGPKHTTRFAARVARRVVTFCYLLSFDTVYFIFTSRPAERRRRQKTTSARAGCVAASLHSLLLVLSPASTEALDRPRVGLYTHGARRLPVVKSDARTMIARGITIDGALAVLGLPSKVRVQQSGPVRMSILDRDIHPEH